ncbi:MAG: ABC transporter ATP-binding protein [Myxococcales bacterium]|nr:ABC transporter ATP-binding protein [Myxococcales bacterium]
MSAKAIELEALRVWREDGLGGSPAEVVRGISVSIAPGARVALVGANGAGKTSLLLALVGAVRFAGRIRVGELVLEKRNLNAVRQDVGFVFAEPADQLFSSTVLDEVSFAPRQRGLSDAAERGRRALEQVGLVELTERVPTSLSLGEQRRLAVASVMSAEPGVLLLDEPTASLDGRARRLVLAAIRSAVATTVFATHDLDAALELEAEVLVMADGLLLGRGPAESVLSDAELLDRAGLDPPARFSRS